MINAADIPKAHLMPHSLTECWSLHATSLQFLQPSRCTFKITRRKITSTGVGMLPKTTATFKVYIKFCFILKLCGLGNHGNYIMGMFVSYSMVTQTGVYAVISADCKHLRNSSAKGRYSGGIFIYLLTYTSSFKENPVFHYKFLCY